MQSAAQLECEELSRGFRCSASRTVLHHVSRVSSDALSQVEHERAQCVMHQRRIDEVKMACGLTGAQLLTALPSGRGVAACGAAWHDGFEGARQVQAESNLTPQ